MADTPDEGVFLVINGEVHEVRVTQAFEKLHNQGRHYCLEEDSWLTPSPTPEA